jgi:hypothetical protein
VIAFLETLKLPININFLGFVFKGKKIVWSPKALANFKHRIREITGRSWAVSWAYRYQQLRRYISGSSTGSLTFKADSIDCSG